MAIAMEQLYHGEILTLAGGDKKPPIDFDQQVFDQAAKWVHDNGGFTADMLTEPPAVSVMNETRRVLNTAISSSIKHETPAELTSALENNAFIFSGLKTYHTLNEVGLKLTNDKGEIKPYQEFRSDVEQVNQKYNQNYLQAEYNHAVHSSQMATKWNDFQQDGDRYDLQYRTADDDRVRDEHAALHNITLSASDPFWSSYLPPNGWNCRCNVVQVRKGKYEVNDSERAITLGDEMTSEPKKQMFRFNAGKSLKIFPDKHPYNKAPKEVKAIVQKQLATKTVAESREHYDSYGSQWEQEYFDRHSGGFVVVDVTRKPAEHTSKNDKAVFEKEVAMCRVLAKAGKRIEMVEEKPGVSSPDITMNGIPTELKRTAGHTNIMAYAKDAFKKKGAKSIVFQFDSDTKAIHTELEKVKAKGWFVYYFFTGREGTIHSM